MREGQGPGCIHGVKEVIVSRIEPLDLPDGPPPGGHYSHAVAFGDLLFAAGQVAVDAAGSVRGRTVAEQTVETLRNLEEVLVAAGSSLDRVLKTTCFLVDIADFAEFNRAYAQAFGEHRPARSTVAVRELVKGCLVEIECVAARE